MGHYKGRQAFPFGFRLSLPPVPGSLWNRDVNLVVGLFTVSLVGSHLGLRIHGVSFLPRIADRDSFVFLLFVFDDGIDYCDSLGFAGVLEAKFPCLVDIVIKICGVVGIGEDVFVFVLEDVEFVPIQVVVIAVHVLTSFL